MKHHLLIMLVFILSLLSNVAPNFVYSARNPGGSVPNVGLAKGFAESIKRIEARQYWSSDNDYVYHDYVYYKVVCRFINESGYYALDEDYVFEFDELSICIYIGSSHVILDGRGNEIRNAGSENFIRFAIIIGENVENVTIMNVRITNFHAGIKAWGSNRDIEIINVSISYSLYGIDVIDAQNVRTADSRFSYIDIYCIRALGVQKLTVAENKFKYCDEAAVGVGTGVVRGKSRPYGIEIYNNTFVMKNTTQWLFWNYAVDVYPASNVKVYNNYVANGEGFYFKDVDNLEIYNNTLEYYDERFWKVRIDVKESRNVKIYGNKLLHRTMGIRIRNSTNVEIYDNIVRDSDIGIVLLVYSNSIYIYNNVFENNTDGITLFTSVSNVYIYNNLFLSRKTNIKVLKAVDEDVDVPRNVYLNTTLRRGENILGGIWIGGNAWLYPNNTGFSQTCRDKKEPIGICDEPFIYRVDQTVLIDYLPLSLKKNVETTSETEITTTATSTYSPETRETSTTITTTEYMSKTVSEHYAVTETETLFETHYRTGQKTKTGNRLTVLFNITIAIIVVTVIITIVIGTYTKLTRTK